MKTNQLMRMAIVAMLWLCIGAGCAKEPPKPAGPQSCRDGTCCGQGSTHYLYAKTYENLLVVLVFSSSGWRFGFEKPLPEGIYGITPRTGAQICDLTQDKALELAKNSGLPLSEYTMVGVKCRVWGHLYVGDEIPTLIIGSPVFFAIDKIELAK